MALNQVHWDEISKCYCEIYYVKCKKLFFDKSCSPTTLLKTNFAGIFHRFCKNVVIFYDLPEIGRGPILQNTF